MCGIAAIYSYHSASYGMDRKELRRIRDFQEKRGPDGKGEFFSEDNRVAFGHRRLAIIDLSDNAAQPLTNEDNSIWLVFNGEIYNYKELRESLIKDGHHFRSQTDSEVIIHLYEEKGKNLVYFLRGMFAFALWDEKKRGLLLARDPFGIKPLYFADDGWTIRVASQVKAIIAGGKVSKEIDPAGLVGYFLWGSVPEPFTIYRNIRAVPAGSTIWINQLGQEEPHNYWSPVHVYQDYDNYFNKKEDIERLIRKSLLESVRFHMEADVPVGAFLSSGIDSSVTVALAREVSNQSIKTVTLSFEEFKGTSLDEAPIAEEIARQYETDHETFFISKEDFTKELPNILKAMDQPSIDGVNTYFVSKVTRDAGLKVALSGLGGDELFGGYPTFMKLPRMVRLLAIPSRLPFTGYLFRSILKIINENPKKEKIRGLLIYGKNYPGVYFLQRGLFMPWELNKILNKDILNDGFKRINPVKYAKKFLYPSPETIFGRIASLEQSIYMKNQLLRDTDWASMFHSLEVRVPLVDSFLFQQIGSLLAYSYDRNFPKKLLFSSPKQQPTHDLLKREKTGFSFPMNEWLKRDLDKDNKLPYLDIWSKDMPKKFSKILELFKKGNLHWSRLWAIKVISSIIET